MFHVAGAFGGMSELGARAGQTTNCPGQVVNADALTVGDVEYAGRTCFQRKEGVGGHDVFHENKIARLSAIAEDA